MLEKSQSLCTKPLLLAGACYSPVATVKDFGRKDVAASLIGKLCKDLINALEAIRRGGATETDGTKLI